MVDTKRESLNIKRRRLTEQAGGSSYFIFYVRTSFLLRQYQIYKIPLFRNDIDSGGSGASSPQRCSSTLPSSSSTLLDFSLNRRRRRPSRSRPMPMPYFQFHCSARFGGYPEEMAMTVLGSTIYFIGGYLWMGTCEYLRSRMVLSTKVYLIDTANPGPPPPEMERMPCQLNSGKRSPVAWTIGGTIYVMPTMFIAGESPGHFECFDPHSYSWTILPSPPFVNDPSKYTIPAHNNHSLRPPMLLVKNHTVLGSSLIITTHEGDFYRFDTAEPHRGWSSVTLQFGSERLKFIPFDSRMSVPIQDGIIFSHLDLDSFPAPDFRCVTDFCYEDRSLSDPYIGPSRVEKSFLKSKCDILPGNSYICGIESDSVASSTLKLSLISPVSIPIGWEESVAHGRPHTDVARIGDGLILFVRRGKDHDEELHYSLNVVRIQRSSEGGEFVASSLSSVLFTSAGELPDYMGSFLMKDDLFTGGF